MAEITKNQRARMIYRILARGGFPAPEELDRKGWYDLVDYQLALEISACYHEAYNRLFVVPTRIARTRRVPETLRDMVEES